MKKLIHLKKWLTLVDAARHISGVLEEEVTEEDLLRLGLDEQIKLSIYFPNTQPAKPAHIELHDVSEFPGFHAENMLIDGSSLESQETFLSTFKDQIAYLQGVFDIPMIFGSRVEVERIFQKLLQKKELPSSYHDGIIVEREGKLFELHTRIDEPAFVSPEKADELGVTIRQLGIMDNFIPRNDFPEESLIIVRIEELVKFEQSINSESRVQDKSLTANERNSLLTIIAALCDYSAIDYIGRGAANQIAKLTEEIGAPVSDDTVRRALAKIPDALESRMK